MCRRWRSRKVTRLLAGPSLTLCAALGSAVAGQWRKGRLRRMPIRQRPGPMLLAGMRRHETVPAARQWRSTPGQRSTHRLDRSPVQHVQRRAGGRYCRTTPGRPPRCRLGPVRRCPDLERHCPAALPARRWLAPRNTPRGPPQTQRGGPVFATGPLYVPCATDRAALPPLSIPCQCIRFRGQCQQPARSRSWRANQTA